MDKKKVVESLFDKKVIKILRLFINNPGNKYYLREIARISKVSPASTYRILTSMKDLDLLIEYKDKHLKTYSLNVENSGMFSSLLEDKFSAMEEFVKKVSAMEEVYSIVKHGEDEKDKANVLLLGENIDQEAIREVTFDIKSKYGFNIIFLVLMPEQYEQMESMGLYPGKKQTLYEK